MTTIHLPNFGPEADPITDWCNLHYASACGALSLVKQHIKHFSKMTGTDTWKRTPLHYAALNGRVEVYNYLKKMGANPDLKDWYGKTARQYLVSIVTSHPSSIKSKIKFN